MAKQIQILLLPKTDAPSAMPRTLTARAGTNLWFQLRKHGIPIGSSCSGVGVCGACVVETRPVQEPKDGQGQPEPSTIQPTSVSPETAFETESKSRHGVPSHCRLACLVRVWQDIECRVRGT
jgi:ferredoxin